MSAQGETRKQMAPPIFDPSDSEESEGELLNLNDDKLDDFDAPLPPLDSDGEGKEDQVDHKTAPTLNTSSSAGTASSHRSSSHRSHHTKSSHHSVKQSRDEEEPGEEAPSRTPPPPNYDDEEDEDQIEPRAFPQEEEEEQIPQNDDKPLSSSDDNNVVDNDEEEEEQDDVQPLPSNDGPSPPPLLKDDDDEDEKPHADSDLQRIGEDLLKSGGRSNSRTHTRTYDSLLGLTGAETTETTLEDENPLTKLLQLLHLNTNPFKDAVKDREIILETDGCSLCVTVNVIEVQWTEEKNRLIHPHAIVKIRGQSPIFQTHVTPASRFNLVAKFHPLDLVEDIIDVIILDGGREIGTYTIPVKDLEPEHYEDAWIELNSYRLHLGIITENVPTSEIPPEFIETKADPVEKKPANYRVLDITVQEALYAPEGRREKMLRPRVDLCVQNKNPHLRTDALKDINRPKWKESYTILVPEPEKDVLDVALLDGNNLIGNAKILIKHIPIGQDCDKWYKLTPLNGNEAGGKIHLIFHAAQVKSLPDECIKFVDSAEPFGLDLPEFSGPPKHNCIKVTVVEGRSLSPSVGKSVIDARLGLQVRGFEPLVCTHCKKQTCNPSWGEFFLFDAPKEICVCGTLDIQLYDGSSRNGHTTMPIGQIMADKVIDGWLDIDATGGPGQVHLRFEWKRYSDEKPPASLIKLTPGGKNPFPKAPLPPTAVKTNSGKRKRTKYVYNGIIDESGVTHDTTIGETAPTPSAGLSTNREPLRQSDFGVDGSHGINEGENSVTGDQQLYSEQSKRKGSKRAPDLHTGHTSTSESTTGGIPPESGLDSNIITGMSQSDFAPWQPGSEEPVDYNNEALFSPPANVGEGIKSLSTTTQPLRSGDFGSAQMKERDLEKLIQSSASISTRGGNSTSDSISAIEFEQETFKGSTQRVKKAPPLPVDD